MQNKNLLIGGAIALIVIILGAGFFMMSKQSKQPTENPQTTSIQESSDQTSVKGSIKSLLTAGKNQTCTIKYPQGDQTSQGTVYISGEKFRGEFVTTSDGKTMDYNMIQDGEFMYSWSSATPQGTKIKISELEKIQASPTSNQVDINSEVDLDCSNWSPDSSKFEVPQNVTFMDLTETLNQTQQQMQNSIPVCEKLQNPTAQKPCIPQVR